MLAKPNELKKIEQVDKPKQDEPPKEVRCDYMGRCFICNEVGHMKRDCMYHLFMWSVLSELKRDLIVNWSVKWSLRSGKLQNP